jgi:hypothetical protein
MNNKCFSLCTLFFITYFFALPAGSTYGRSYGGYYNGSKSAYYNKSSYDDRNYYKMNPQPQYYEKKNSYDLNGSQKIQSTGGTWSQSKTLNNQKKDSLYQTQFQNSVNPSTKKTSPYESASKQFEDLREERVNPY